MARRSVALAVTSLGLVVAGCGGATKTVTRTAPAGHGSTLSKSQAASQYTADVDPVNAALNAFGQAASGWNSSTTGAQAYAESKPTIQALHALAPKLATLADEYPPAATDIKALISAFAPLSGELTSLQTLNRSSASRWATQFLSDAAKSKSAAAAVRTDLGLPPGGSS